MSTRDQVGREVRHSTSANGEGRSKRASSPRSSRAGRSLMRSHSAADCESILKLARSASIRRDASRRFVSTNVVMSLPESRIAWSMRARSSTVARTSMRWFRFRVVVDMIGSRCTATNGTRQGVVGGSNKVPLPSLAGRDGYSRRFSSPGGGARRSPRRCWWRSVESPDGGSARRETARRVSPGRGRRIDSGRDARSDSTLIRRPS